MKKATTKSRASKSSMRRPAAASLPGYGRQTFWEQRYRKILRGVNDSKADEWLFECGQFVELLPCKKTSAILDVGCGISRLLMDLQRKTSVAGRLVGIDYSSSAIKLCETERACPGVEYIKMDARQMDFSDSSFDLAVDKATLDGQLCGRGAAATTCSEIARILRPGGSYVLVTWRGEDRPGGLSWLSECVWPALHKGAAGYSWRVDMHSLPARKQDGTALPNIYIFRKSKTPKKSPMSEPLITKHMH